MWTLPDGSTLRVDHTRHGWYYLDDRPITYEEAEAVWQQAYPKSGGQSAVGAYLTRYPR